MSAELAPSSTSAETSTSAPTTTSIANERPLDDVEACPLLDTASLPASWQPLMSDPEPLVQLGASNCFITQPGGTGFGIVITLYRGPGEGIDSLSQTTVSTPTPIDIAVRNARIYRDTGGNTCGILFDFGPDQGLIVGGSSATESSDDPCDVVTIAATAMVPNLPPS